MPFLRLKRSARPTTDVSPDDCTRYVGKSPAWFALALGKKNIFDSAHDGLLTCLPERRQTRLWLHWALRVRVAT